MFILTNETSRPPFLSGCMAVARMRRAPAGVDVPKHELAKRPPTGSERLGSARRAGGPSAETARDRGVVSYSVAVR